MGQSCWLNARRLARGIVHTPLLAMQRATSPSGRPFTTEDQTMRGADTLMKRIDEEIAAEVARQKADWAEIVRVLAAE